MEEEMQVEFSVDISGFQSLDAVHRQGRLDRAALTDLAATAESAGIDRLVLADPDGKQDAATLASYIFHATSTLGIEIEHRAGAVEPEIAARQIATLDQLSGGRLRARIAPPAVESLSHEEGCARLDEYLVLLKRLWSNDGPIDHEGRFYRLKAAFSAVKPFNGASVPLVLAGVSGTALHVAARHADIFVLPASGTDEARLTIERVKAAAQSYGRVRAIRFALPARGMTAGHDAADAPANAGVLFGPVEKIASRIGAYSEVGVTDFIVSGLQTARDVSVFGRTVVEPMRRSLGERDGGELSARSANVVFGRWSRYRA
jgi:alkanesulfonate monooxygenase